jgi:hypothetical protein
MGTAPRPLALAMPTRLLAAALPGHAPGGRIAMRKLLTMLNAILRDHRPWLPA